MFLHSSSCTPLEKILGESTCGLQTFHDHSTFLHVVRVTSLFLPGRYQSLVAAYGEAKRERFLRELAEMEENVHVARSQAQDKLDKYAIQEMVGGPLGFLVRHGSGRGSSA